ncbi:helix-turn-helix domain-containing protein [Campylobacter lanienae]|uniref:XRE family transcriptional regulator n=1 Tax=Campylobacter lanienae TaxID=75658 RepID=A0ABY3GAT5_9BACT|nr:transcriptional regulator [Campylobacter lanienae]TWO30642.1 XRE family transcriptional regulator [Campylobacter lanienae]
MLSEKENLKAYKKIGQNVAKARKERNVSQLSLSLEMGYKSVSVVSFAEICLNGAHFNIAHLLQISKILGLPLNHILDDV